MNWKGLVLLLVLVAVIAPIRVNSAAQVEGDPDDGLSNSSGPFLVVRRTFKDDVPLEGKETTVSIQIHNTGSSPATNVEIVESSWPSEEFLVTGHLSASLGTIAAGATTKHTYKLTPKDARSLMHGPVTVTYSTDTGTKTTSSKEIFFRSYTIVEFGKQKALEFGAQMTAGYLSTPSDWIKTGAIGGGLLGAVLVYKSYTKISAANTNRKRNKAVQELLKSQ